MAGPAPLGVPKDEFLAAVRQSLGRAAGPPQPAYPPLEENLEYLESQARQVRQRLEQDQAARLDRLAETAALRGWQVHRAAGPEDALGYIAALAQKLGARQVVRSDQDALQKLPLDAALGDLGIGSVTVSADEANPRESLRAEIARSGLGITGADYAVAETGSVVVLPRKGLSRLVSLVPPVHLALVQPHEVVDTLDDLFLLRRLEYYRNGGDMGSYLNFITGPSRTADIEQTLVVGVHGPKEVHLALLG